MRDDAKKVGLMINALTDHFVSELKNSQAVREPSKDAYLMDILTLLKEEQQKLGLGLADILVQGDKCSYSLLSILLRTPLRSSLSALSSSLSDSQTAPLVRFLLEEGVPITEVNHPRKISDLYEVVRHNRPECLELLLEHGGEVHLNENALLQMCIMEGWPKILEILASHPQIDLEKKDELGRTALGVALAYSQNGFAEALINAGANCHIVNRDGLNSIQQLVASEGSVSLLKRLISEGVDINAMGERSEPAIMFALYDDLLEHAQVLIEHGADLLISHPLIGSIPKLAKTLPPSDTMTYVLGALTAQTEQKDLKRIMSLSPDSVGISKEKRPIKKKPKAL